MKLSGRDTYGVWKTQLLCLLESHDMLDFITHEDKASDHNHKLWRRSDALVKGWILGSLSQQPLKFVVKTNTNVTSKDVWDKLQTIYDPPAPLQDATVAADYATRDAEERIGTAETIEQDTGEEKKSSETRKEEKAKQRAARALYEATLNQDIWSIEAILCGKQCVKLTDKITINGNTALHVAVSTTKKRQFLEKMLNLATKDNQEPLNMQNSEGSTLLHVAAIVGNTEAAEILVRKNSKLLYANDNEGQTPLGRALSNMHTDTYLYLSKRTDIQHLNTEAGTNTRYELLVNIISSKNYSAALEFFDSDKKKLLTDIDKLLMAIAQNFPSKLNFWERTLVGLTCSFTFSGYRFKLKSVEAINRKEMDYLGAISLLRKLCYCIASETDTKSSNYYNNAILEATRQNAYEVVVMIVSYLPDAIWSANEDGHNIIQYAVINRSEKIYNLLYQMSEHKNIYKTTKDPFGNNLLHLAARLAPPDKLKHISGAAMQIQHKLQWFKEVEGFVCPLNIIQKNWFEETPQMVFTREHKELVIDGEKWMKETAQSYTITAALITTIVFAAAITVPGGNKQDNGNKHENGIPVFTNNPAFTIFAISDAISLFTSVTSLLMFLSILTARFSEQDFLLKLPTKLIIGLATLFISATAMLVAFGATLFLVFGQNNPQILVPVVALTCLPIICFATLQFPLIKDLISSTYGCSIFGKKSDRPFY
ncbi:uncharacterized protein LOC143626542 [Bidens hawaiensis]|uniref:uncharacterized protein LOC143626542 n=1 Tax=Bidens hawaiensis TaxID=980011 RepID=UPI00404A9EDA